MPGIRSDRVAIRMPLGLIAVGAIGGGVALLLAMGAAVQRTAFEGGVSTARVAAVHLTGALEQYAKSVGDLAERIAEAPSPTDREQFLLAWLSLHRLSFTHLAIVDNGKLHWVEIRQPSVSAALGRQAEELARAALRRRSAVGKLVDGADGRGPIVLLATPIPGGVGGGTEATSALIASLEAEGVGGAALDALAAGGQSDAFLASGDGTALLARAPRRSRGSGADDPRPSAEDFKSLAAAALVDNRSTHVLESSGHTILAVTVGFEAVGSRWVVGAARPWRMSFGKADRFLLLAGLGGLVLLAGVVGVVAAVRRVEGRLQGEETEGRRDRATTDAARLEAWRHALLTMGEFPVMELKGTRIVAANALAARYLGVKSSALLAGRDVLELVASRDRERLARFLAQRIPEGGDEEALPIALVTAGRSTRVADMRRLPSGEAPGGSVLLAWRDGTGRERGEALARTLSAVTNVPLVFVDAVGTLVWSNQAFAETARRLGVQVSTATIMELFRPAHRRLLRVMFGAALRGKGSEKLIPLALGGGEQLAVVLRAAPVLAAGEVFGVVFAAPEIRGAPPGAVSLELTHRAEALAQLAAALSHRLNNDVQAVQGLLAAARSQGAGPVGAAVVNQLHATARELQRFVNVCRRSGASLRPVRLSVVLDGWRKRKVAEVPPGVRLTLKSEVTEDRVIVDARQIESFLDYALATTVRYLKSEGGAVQVAVERGGAPGTVRLSVRDTAGEVEATAAGARDGLPDTMARETLLAVAQLVAERHGGAAGQRSTAGVGSQVWIELPLRPGAVAEQPAVLRQRRRGLVMVADDEEMVRTSLAAALREEGFAVEEASNGAEVLERVLAAPRRYALVVLDLVMPVVDGREVYRRLSRELPGLPVLLCTGYDPGEDEEFIGADTIVKPCPLEMFVERVRSLTDASPATVIG